MKRLLIGFLFISFTVCFITGCRQPVGGVGGIDADEGDGDTADLNFLWLVPNRLLYETEERFERDNDLQIMVVEEGKIKSVPPSDSGVTIAIIENPGLSSENVTVVTSMYHSFSLPGRHVVQVKYDNKSAKYSIEVRGNFTNPGDGSDFMEIVWL